MAKKGTSSAPAGKAKPGRPGADTTKAPPQPATPKRRATKAEPIPLRWKVVGIAEGLALTLLKATDKSAAESELSRLRTESRYRDLGVYPIDAKVPSPNQAKEERERARVHRTSLEAGQARPRWAKAASRASKTSARDLRPAAKAARASPKAGAGPKTKATKAAGKTTTKAATKSKSKNARTRAKSAPRAAAKRARSKSKTKAAAKAPKAKKAPRTAKKGR